MEPPCIVSATEYAGMHNAGFYCIYPTKLKEMTQEISFVDCATFWTSVLSDEESVAACRISDNEVRALLRGSSDIYSLQEHQQEMLSLVWRGTGVDQCRIHSVRSALTNWVHALGLFGNSHFSAADINSKTCRKLINLSEEAMTLEWAGISFEQGSWQYIIRIAAISNASSLVPLLSGNAGYMVAENLHRFELHGEIGNVDSLTLQPIQNAEEFLEPFKSMAQWHVYNDVLESPSVVNLFGHHKNNHLML